MADWKLKILSDPSRIEILKALGQGPMFSQELRERLSLSPGTITHHMSLLVGEGYVTVKKEEGPNPVQPVQRGSADINDRL